MSTERGRGVQPMVARARPRLRAAVLTGGTAVALVFVAVVVGMETTDGQLAPATLPEAATVAVEGDDAADLGADEDLTPIYLPLVAYELLLARDPFEPVVPEPDPELLEPSVPVDPADPAVPGDPGVTVVPGDPGGTPVPGIGDDGEATVGNGDGAAVVPSCTRGVEVVCDGRVLTIVEILEENGELVVVIQVDTMRWRVSVGDIFADVFEVLSISADEVRVMYGDRIVTLLVRDNVLK